MPFEDELGEALRRAGDGFTADRHALVDAGERRGRRLVARRRASVIGGSVLALAVVGSAGAWTAGLLGGPGQVDVAAPSGLPTGLPTAGPGQGGGAASRGGTGAVSDKQLIAVLKELTPGGQLTDTEARGTGDEPGPMVRGVFDDGKGKAAIGVSLTRIDPTGQMATEMTKCPDAKHVQFDSCKNEVLADGSRLLLFQGYEYPDRREPTKAWRATLATPQGFLVDASEWNAPAEKGAKVSRTDPPLTMAQMKTLVTSDKWRPALNDLPPAPTENQPAPSRPDIVAKDALEVMVRKYEVPTADSGGEGGDGHVILDDGKGGSRIELRIQQYGPNEPSSSDFDSGTTSEPNGVKAKVTQQPADGKGVVMWRVDTLRSNGVRITVTGYNSMERGGPATRTAPVLTVAQLKELALSPKWKDHWGR
ncbi:hypothetical protein [Streptomyces sp. NBC_01408]|uniref:hypothetical protein n=1 Tax=Streptomyces sp. NBC_01408 TaxID=2903855 RepID=UPI0022572143|nr:hypothetical protein [Streptomyces sp. NBC_01408]MCX4692546.1 hypothetical protein [Streptomyces sp. NBC_01408]